MVNANLYADTVEKKKDDAKELVAILNKIPEEKKEKREEEREEKRQEKG